MMSNLPVNASADDYGGSPYFNADYVRDHGPFRGLTVADVNQEFFDRRDGKPGKDKRLVLSFKEHDNKLALNTTRRNVMKDAFGDKPLPWIGTVIDVVHDPSVMFAGRAKGGVRIQNPRRLEGVDGALEEVA